MQIDQYLDAAISARGFSSDRELSRALGLSGVGVSLYRTKRSWPSDEIMVALAELAGLDVQRALLDLNTWRAKSSRVRELYSRLAGELVPAILAAVLTVPLLPIAAEQPANALRSALPNLYIMR